ncbi:hypothetical protein PMAYCL1PPCAC_26492, partial [Pristionchus mayeri]
MKRTAKPNRRVKGNFAKGEVITIDDDEPAIEQPVVKNVKKEKQPPVQSSPALSVAELQEKLKKSEEKCQRAIHIAGQHLARAEHLEKLIDTKPDVSQDAIIEDLKKKLGEVTNELVDERQRGDEERQRGGERIADLTRQLEAEKVRALEGRNVLYERMNVLTDDLE